MQAAKSSCSRSAGEAPVTYFGTSCAAMNCGGGRSRICTTRISGRSAPRSLSDWQSSRNALSWWSRTIRGQLGMLIRMECGLDIPDKILKYDGRPFFYDELLSSVIERCASTSEKENFSGFEYEGTSS